MCQFWHNAAHEDLPADCDSCRATAAQGIQYPVTRTVDDVDTYHGTKVPDPYRWLEDDTSAETARWVEAQNKVTFAYLDTIPYRAALTKRLNALYNYAKFGSPSRKGYYFPKNDGLQNQACLHPEGA
jgi:prolyl oligopeptidase